MNIINDIKNKAVVPLIARLELILHVCLTEFFSLLCQENEDLNQGVVKFANSVIELKPV